MRLSRDTTLYLFPLSSPFPPAPAVVALAASAMRVVALLLQFHSGSALPMPASRFVIVSIYIFLTLH